MNKQTSNFYNRFAVFYPLVDYFLNAQKRTLAAIVNELPPGNLLEIGVGNGSHLHLYQNHQITGIDSSSAMLKQAEKHKSKNIELIEMNGEQLLFEENKFDYIVLSHVIAVTENPDRLINESFRVLKSNGKLIILNHFTPENWLKYIDQFFRPISRLFHLNSVFKIADVIAIQKFKPEKEIVFGKLAYFKLLIYSKN